MNHLAYPRRAAASFLSMGAVAMGALAMAAFGCTAGVRMSSAGSGGSTGSGGSGGKGGSGTGGQVVFGSGGDGGDVGLPSDAGFNPDAMACQTKNVVFAPTIPTVFILVDRSGSEFDSATSGTFFTLRPAVEQVVNDLQGKVRFGFGAFVGNGSNPNCSVEFADSVVPFALNNATAISKEYDMLGMAPGKANTPMSDVIPMIKSMLMADQANASGAKYLLIVSDSETDFCDDGSAICPADAMIYKIQDLYASGFGTLVIGLPTDSSSGTSDPIAATVLQDFANAGVGQPVILPQPNSGQTIKPSDVYDQCNSAGYNPSTNTWMSVYTAAGHTAADHTSIATYSAAAGTAIAYTPSGTDTQSLITQISTALNSIPPSCVFDLTGFKIDLTKLNEAGVLINGQIIPLDTKNANGWDMVSATELQLYGNACSTLQTPNATESITFDFPCDLIITIDQP